MRTGIRRKVDDLGRIVIPAPIRRTLGIREGDAVEVHVDGEQIILSKPTDQCVFCRGEDDLRAFRGRPVCASCVTAIGVLDGETETRVGVAEEAENSEEHQPPSESSTAW